jgi:hypothetical protein
MVKVYESESDIGMEKCASNLNQFPIPTHKFLTRVSQELLLHKLINQFPIPTQRFLTKFHKNQTLLLKLKLVLTV